ncbi:spore germination protein GerPC [Paenibacillus oenotherae]|nr:spore germination protein GerPC [Paenibacillus oenotherae]
MQPTNGYSYSPWDMCKAMSQQIQQLTGMLEQQQAALMKLSREVSMLTERVTSAESKPMYNIERLEYNFDQLKVEKLDGTLNIGMTPPNEEQFKEIGQVVIPGGNQQAPLGLTDHNKQSGDAAPFLGMNASTGADGALSQPPYPEIRRDVDLYLTTAAPAKLAQLEAELGLTLDQHHRNLIIEDIRRQISTRINFYIQAASKKEKSGGISNEPTIEQIHSDVVAKTTRDIDTALRGYVTKLKSSG